MLEEFDSPEGNQIQFFGNINVGRDVNHDVEVIDDSISVPVPILKQCYHAVVFVCRTGFSSSNY